MNNHKIYLTESYISKKLNNPVNNKLIYNFSDVSFLGKITDTEPKPASVLVPLVQVKNHWFILFTRRNNELPEHSGQVAFPGGSADPDDLTPKETALRETYEEIGVKPTDVQILGRLQNYYTITNYKITPIVGRIPYPYPFRLEPKEVSKIFRISISWLSNRTHYEERQQILPAPFSPIPVIYYKPYHGEILWGASARITVMLLNILGLNGNSD
jgi:8-oxo-dGTP pyrophosphatase MutT (NUDIX family)